jgi:transcriptional regulator with XRE-family HTH domain
MTTKNLNRLESLTPQNKAGFTPNTPGDATCHTDVLAYYVSATKLAKHLGISVSTLSQWKKRGIPLEWVHAFEKYSSGCLHVTVASIYAKHNLLENVQ